MFFLMIRRPPTSTRTGTLFPYPPPFRSDRAAGDRASLSSGHGRVIDGEAHRQRRWVDWLGIERLADRNISYRIGNRRNGKTGEADDVTCLGALHGNAVQSTESHDLGRAAGFNNLSVSVERMDRLVADTRAGMDKAGQYTAKEVVE